MKANEINHNSEEPEIEVSEQHEETPSESVDENTAELLGLSEEEEEKIEDDNN